MNFAKDKKMIYSVAVLVILIVIGAVLYIKMKKDEGSTEDGTLLPKNTGTSYTLDVGVLQSDFIQGLTRHGSYPIEPRFPGRKNPFEPY